MIILTGASGGIGTAILSDLSRLDNVIAVYNKKRPNIEELKNVEWVQVDLSDEAKIKDFANDVKSSISKITLIYTAAITIDKLTWQLDVNDWQEVLDTNLKSNFLLTKEFLFPMIKESWGRIIHFSSIAGNRGAIGTLAYSASKSGILGMSKVLAKEYGKFGITSNVITPGYIDTGLIELLTEEGKEEALKTIPLGKFGDPSNIVNAIEFIIKSDYVNGISIDIDGGI